MPVGFGLLAFPPRLALSLEADYEENNQDSDADE